jgi:hypothetical protein
MVRRDYGSAVAADAARLSVMPLERDGGQAQFIVHEPPGSSGSLRPLLQWLQSHLHERLTLDAMAQQYHMSVRTLSRKFLEQTGTTPLQWLLLARVRRAGAARNHQRADGAHCRPRGFRLRRGNAGAVCAARGREPAALPAALRWPARGKRRHVACSYVGV